MSLLALRGVGKRFGPILALENVDLDVAAGTRTAIVGPSGSGKTTLLRIVAGFETADTGTLTLGGETLADAQTFLPAHKRGIGFVPQDGALFPHLSVGANIVFGLPRGAAGNAARLAELLDLVELPSGLTDRRPHELSGGQQQRVALARALARRPQLILLDEPFSALDTALRDSVREATAAVLSAAGVTTILVTHDRAEALSFADQVAVLRAGRLVDVGPPQRLYRSPRDAETAAFLGPAIVIPAEVRDGQADCALGRIPVASAATEGPARLLLRPEQLRLQPWRPDRLAAEVSAISFAGSTSLVTLVLPAWRDRPPQPIRVSVPGAIWAAGDKVTVEVQGAAHVLADEASPAA
ncbi:MAG: ABC transporter ATP-binding protein [Bauldia sp.]